MGVGNRSKEAHAVADVRCADSILDIRRITVKELEGPIKWAHDFAINVYNVYMVLCFRYSTLDKNDICM